MRKDPDCPAGRRPVFGGAEKFQSDPCWRDCLFYEYFHGDNGAGIGASHQTGWTGLVAPLIEIFGRLDADALLEGGRAAPYSITNSPRSNGRDPPPMLWGRQARVSECGQDLTSSNGTYTWFLFCL